MQLRKLVWYLSSLKKFTTGYVHHLVGHFSNVDFWLAEVVAALKTIDEHNSRFQLLYDAQKNGLKTTARLLMNSVAFVLESVSLILVLTNLCCLSGIPKRRRSVSAGSW